MYENAEFFCMLQNFVLILAEKPRLDLATVSNKKINPWQCYQPNHTFDTCRGIFDSFTANDRGF